MQKDHRAAEVVPRSGSTEPRDLVATREMGFLGNSDVIVKGKIHPETSRGIAPQPTVFQYFSVRPQQFIFPRVLGSKASSSALLHQ